MQGEVEIGRGRGVPRQMNGSARSGARIAGAPTLWVVARAREGKALQKNG